MEVMMAVALQVPWPEICLRFNGGTLVVGDPRFFQAKGPIQSLKHSPETERLIVQLEWLACRRNPDEGWVKAPELSKTFALIASECTTREFDPQGRLKLQRTRFRDRGEPAVLLPMGIETLDPRRVLSEFYVAVTVKHSLYPPHPFRDEFRYHYSDLEHVGTVRNINPRRPKAQSDAKEVEITFVVRAKTYEGAVKWCRGECARWDLPVISIQER
jgi:hypothetical protein